MVTDNDDNACHMRMYGSVSARKRVARQSRRKSTDGYSSSFSSPLPPHSAPILAQFERLKRSNGRIMHASLEVSFSLSLPPRLFVSASLPLPSSPPTSSAPPRQATGQMMINRLSDLRGANVVPS